MGVGAEEGIDAGGRYVSSVLGVCHWILVRLWLVCVTKRIPRCVLLCCVPVIQCCSFASSLFSGSSSWVRSVTSRD